MISADAIRGYIDLIVLSLLKRQPSYSGVSDSGKSRTYYRLTPEGAAHLAAKVSEWEDTKTLIDRFAKGAH